MPPTQTEQPAGVSPALRHYDAGSKQNKQSWWSTARERCFRRPIRWVDQHLRRMHRERDIALHKKVKKAAIGCYQTGGDPPRIEKVFPVHLKFSPAIIEQMFAEWRSVGDREWEIMAIICILFIISYFWIMDWFDPRDAERKPVRLTIKGCILGLALCLPSVVPPKTGKAVWNQQRKKLALLLIIVFLKYMRILYEVSTLLYVRSVGIWGNFIRTVLLFGSGLHVYHFLILNAFNTAISLVWHYGFRKFSVQHVFQWEIVLLFFFQIQYYLMMLRKREDFRRRVIAYMEAKVSEEIATVHEFVAHYSRDIIVLHDVDIQGYHRFKFVSSAVEAITGWTSDQLVGRRVIDFVYDKDREIIEQALSVAAYKRPTGDGWGEVRNDGEVWNQAYSKKLESVQRKFSKVLTDFVDPSFPSRSEESFIVTPTNRDHNELPSLHRRKRKHAAKDAAEESWSEAVMTHAKFTRLFSTSNSPATVGLDYIYRAGVLCSWRDENSNANNDATEVIYGQQVVANETKKNEPATRKDSDSTTKTNQGIHPQDDDGAPIPGILKYHYEPSSKVRFHSSFEDDAVEQKLEGQGNRQISITKSDLSSLPSFGKDYLGDGISPQSSTGSRSFSFRMISKAGTTVPMEASCNWTPQGVVAVYREVSGRSFK